MRVYQDWQKKVVHNGLLFSLLVVQINQLIFAAETSAEWRYSVRSGDNLIHFGQRYLINPDDWRVLQNLNHIKNPAHMPLGSILRVPLNLVKQNPASAEVTLASGQANIVNADNSLQSVAVGQQLTAGKELVTGENSKLNIKFADGSVISMGPNSHLKLDTLSIYNGGGMVDTTLRLQQGRAEVQANPQHVQGNQMHIITPSAVAAVRGTTFRVSADGEIMRQETLEGKVALIAAAQEVPVDKGFGSLSEAGNAPLPPVLLLPAPATEALAAKLEAIPVKFTMATQEGAVAWLGRVSSDAKFNTLAAQKVSQGTDLSFADLPDGEYYLSVRAQDKQGIEGYDALHKFVLKARPFAPQATAPAAGQTLRDANPEITWTKVEAADQYLLELAKEIDFKQIFHAEKLTANQYKVTKELEPGQYFWRVASIAGDNQGPYMAANNFAYKAKPPTPDISQLKVSLSPNNNKALVTTVNPPEGLTYSAVLDDDAGKQKHVWQGAGLGGEFSFLLEKYGKQTLRLRLIEADGVAGPEASYEFEVKPK